jgi:hypothetical protein
VLFAAKATLRGRSGCFNEWWTRSKRREHYVVIENETYLLCAVYTR